MSRHISADELASYAEGELRPRKAATAASHLAGCPECSAQLQALQQVPSLLASVQHPPMPDNLSARIEFAIAGESAARVASEPASEAGRRDLPVRSGRARKGWRMPRLSSSLGLRLAAGTAAAVIIGAGGYEIASHTGGQSTVTNGPKVASGVSEAPGFAPAQMKLGPSLRYTRAGHVESIQMAQAATNFEPGTFRTQTEAAIKSEQVEHNSAAVRLPNSGAYNAQASTARPTPAASPGFVVSNLDRVRACVGLIAAGRNLLLVELAMFKGFRATIIVVAPTATSPAYGYAVGPACSGSDRAVLFSLALPGM